MEGKPFALLGINSDTDKDELKKVMEQEGITWRSWWNGPKGTGGPLSRQWNVQGWPTLYLIDAKGVIRYKGDYLRSSSLRPGKDGKLESFDYLDEAAEALVKEAEDGQKR